ncbi:DNA-directed RNA polymerase subunit beta' [Candidatus Roizmanbacteria bacterium RIFCSPLOWO2_02_FULL_38_10]|uniref:DNA-directed RNA polymerase subunit beta' n=1 Tax=Candidatus Roizmanbacteria bacterium RIFCSPLOWO2_02_FULL_38_10 TaxID=1802074 RepID=A0A1F7JMQ1_9BACT|nr:MAG: DNA-directed RNA polymerase subunit beta' [Candidatus Roizmanbacteria bacterium RIFCSPLOWO2_02_FULL_38_10]
MSTTKKNTAQDFKIIDFSGLKLMLASPEVIAGWSHGEVLKPETINYRTFKPEKDGLFDERIFGPTKDYECYCGKYKRIRYKGIICDRCGVEITTNSVRRERMGHLKLASPIAHIWYFKGVSSPLRVLLDIPSNNLERIIYYALYLVKDINEEKRKKTLEGIKKIYEKELDVLDEKNKIETKRIKDEEQKEKNDIEVKVKNKERKELTINEIEFKYRERYVGLNKKYAEKKADTRVYYERIEKLVQTLSPLGVIEEEDYLFFKDKNLDNFMSVGMGSEVILEILNNLDINKLHSEAIKKLIKTKGNKRTQLVKKIRLIESFMKSGVSPKSMILVVLPVIPPDLRPVVQLSGGKFATSDLNDFYRRVINRNNRLKHLIELGAPEIILRNEKRMLQEAVDSLIDFQKSRGRSRIASSSVKALKSLSDILSGKQGRFRQNLLGKRVDYSGRSVIIVGPDLKINQCGLPKEMALELFKPFLLREVIIRGLAQNIKSARNFLDRKEPVVYDILEEITKNHPVLLNRAPTLHKLSVLAFFPVLTDDYAIKLHPTVTAGYNADFDGDQMGVFVPLSQRAITEVSTRMLPEQNLLKPSDGSPIVLPTKEMALGCYYLTTIDDKYNSLKDEQLKYFASEDESMVAYRLHKIATREPIWVRIKDKAIKTTVGRIIFNSELLPELRFINTEVKAVDLKAIINQALDIYQNDYEKIGGLIDNLKEIGFWGATISGGVSVSVFDCKIIKEKESLINKAESEVKDIEKNYLKGLITEEEKRRNANDIWIDITENMAKKTWDIIEEENPVKIIIKSGGARASIEQIKQLSAMKGLVIDPLGKIIEVPTKSNYREGLSIFEYVINARGARKGLTDSALKTADAGYLTRRLVDVSHDMIIKEEDCGTQEGLLIAKEDDRSEKFFDRIKYRFALKKVIGKNKKTILKENELITPDLIKILQDNEIDRMVVRSSFYCQTKHGVCQRCYGADMSNNGLVEIGTPVGVIAAQSIGEPGTQLTMRVRHFGGIVIADVTQGLPRVEELFETRTPKVVSPICDIAGKVSIQEDTEKESYIVKIKSTDEKTAEEREFNIPTSRKLKVHDGQLIPSGKSLCEGYLDIKEILAVQGLREAQLYLLNEIQKVYESQGIMIHDKHFEVIIRKMSDKVIIEQEGDTSFIIGEVVSKHRFEEENRQVLSQGGTPATGRVSILGVTRSAMHTDSWLSAASFQGTTSALMDASIKGQIDYLLGLKENVIIGRLIPVTETLLTKYYGSEKDKEAIIEEQIEQV